MTFIETNFDEIVEPKAAPEGKYQLQVVKADVTETGPNSKNPGAPMYKVTLGFADAPNIPNFQHYIVLPSGTDTDQQKLLGLKRFLVLFNVPFDNSGFDIEGLAMEMVGASAEGSITLGEPNEAGNVYNSLMVPRIKGEQTGAGRASPPRR